MKIFWFQLSGSRPPVCLSTPLSRSLLSLSFELELKRQTFSTNHDRHFSPFFETTCSPSPSRTSSAVAAAHPHSGGDKTGLDAPIAASRSDAQSRRQTTLSPTSRRRSEDLVGVHNRKLKLLQVSDDLGSKERDGGSEGEE